MREIKFRAVIKYNKIQKQEAERFGGKNIEYAVIYFTLNDLIDPLFSIRELLIPWLRKGNIPDLYIGLYDKNKKEICGGDIVKFINDYEIIEPSIGLIEYGDGEFFIKTIKEGSFKFPKDRDCEDDREYSLSFYSYDGKEFRWKELEIIGNIYENPELVGK